MDIIKLPAGEEAPVDSDCVRIRRQADGSYKLAASALMQGGDSDEAPSVAIGGSEPYHSYEEAEAAGLAWAADLGVDTIYLES